MKGCQQEHAAADALGRMRTSMDGEDIDGPKRCERCGRPEDRGDPESRLYLVGPPSGVWCRTCLRKVDPEHLMRYDLLDQILKGPELN